jgi:hypothetical protein
MAASAMNVSVLGARIVALVRLRRSTGIKPVPETSTSLASR